MRQSTFILFLDISFAANLHLCVVRLQLLVSLLWLPASHFRGPLDMEGVWVCDILNVHKLTKAQRNRVHLLRSDHSVSMDQTDLWHNCMALYCDTPGPNDYLVHKAVFGQKSNVGPVDFDVSHGSVDRKVMWALSTSMPRMGGGVWWVQKCKAHICLGQCFIQSTH